MAISFSIQLMARTSRDQPCIGRARGGKIGISLANFGLGLRGIRARARGQAFAPDTAQGVFSRGSPARRMTAPAQDQCGYQ